VTPPDDQRRPLATDGVEKVTAATASNSSPSIDNHGYVEELARYVDSTFVVMVNVPRGKYRHRRGSLLTVAAAQEAVERDEARCSHARILVREPHSVGA